MKYHLQQIRQTANNQRFVVTPIPTTPAIQIIPQIILNFLADVFVDNLPNTNPATTFAIAPREIKLVNIAAFHPLNSDNVPEAAFIALPTAVAVKYARKP